MITVNLSTEVRYSAVGEMRDAVVNDLRRAGLDLDDEIAYTVRLLLSEVLTNALEHGYGGEVADPCGRLRVTATANPRAGLLRVVVPDPGAGIPAERQASGEDIDGRGLALVSSLASDFGWERDEGGGAGMGPKRVWFEVEIDPVAFGTARCAQEATPEALADMRTMRSGAAMAVHWRRGPVCLGGGSVNLADGSMIRRHVDVVAFVCRAAAKRPVETR